MRSPNFSRINRVILVSVLTASLVGAIPLVAQDNQQKQGQDQSENDRTHPEKKTKKLKTWEYLVNIPGQIIYFPFYVIYSGIKTSIAWMERNEVPAKVRDFLEADDGSRALYPTYATRRGGGFKYFHHDLLTPGSKLSLTATVGLHWKQLYRARLRRLQVGEDFLAFFETYYRIYTDENFFGIGNDSEKGDESSFAWRQVSLRSSIGRSLGRTSAVSLSLGLDLNDIARGRTPNVPSLTELSPEETVGVFGIEGKANLIDFSLILDFDNRNRIGNPTSGWLIKAESGFHWQIDDDRFRFLKSSFDVTRHFHLFHDRALLVRFASEINRPIQGGEIPFYYLSRLGERETIRGWRRGRFRDRDMNLLSFEYRFPLIRRPLSMINLSAILFMDLGKVSDNIIADKIIGGYHKSFGGGFRVFTRKGVALQLFIGFSRDGYRIYMVIAE